MKKKLLAAAIAVALIAIMVSGSLAYFTSTDDVKNTFTVGSVKIEIYENNKVTDSDTMAFTKPLTPVVNTQNPSADESYIHKAVKVQNTGANAAYIRTHLAIPTALVNYVKLDVDTENGWTLVAQTGVTKDGVAYMVYTYDFAEQVEPNAFTKDLLKGVYLDSKVDLEENADGNLEFILRENGEKTADSDFVAHTKNADGSYTSRTVNVLVASQAIQAEGFDSGATAALNAGFPANPWQ